MSFYVNTNIVPFIFLLMDILELITDKNIEINIEVFMFVYFFINYFQLFYALLRCDLDIYIKMLTL